MTERNKVITLMGPTATGKTDLALRLVEQFPLEIISVDSAMIYRGMDIGTGKPPPEILKKIPHHLVNILDPSEAYSAARFVMDTKQLIQQIHAKAKTPLLVGGTMLYFKALREGLADLPPATPEVRAKLAHEAESLGLEQLHQRLTKIDPIAAARIHPNDPQRLLRALEVYEVTGKSLSEHLESVQQAGLAYDLCELALMPEKRSWLHDRIALRFHHMLAAGFIDEVKCLYERGDLSLNMPAIRCVGYRQVWQYLAGQLSYDEMVERAIIATRQLAKRQLTWLRSFNRVEYLQADNENVYHLLVKAVTQYMENSHV